MEQLEKKESEYIENRYWAKKLGGKILITTYHGSWLLLNDEEYSHLRQGRLEENIELFKKLEEKGIILTENNFDNINTTMRTRFSHFLEGITDHSIILTRRDSSTPLYSDFPISDATMNLETADAIINFILQSPAKQLTINFKGGEPLLNFEVMKHIVNSLSFANREIEFQVYSNLNQLNERILSFLIENNVKVFVYLDGPKEIHEKNRSGFEETAKGIQLVMENASHLLEAAITTVTEHSLHHEKEIIDALLHLGIKKCWLRPLDYVNAAKPYEPEKFVGFWKNYTEYLKELNEKGVEFQDYFSSLLSQRISTINNNYDPYWESSRFAGVAHCAYDTNGDVYLSDRAIGDELFKIGNVKESSYKDVFTSQEVAQFIGLATCETTFCDTCVWHPFCSPNLISSYKEYNNLIAQTPHDYYCKIRMRVNEEIIRNVADF